MAATIETIQRVKSILKTSLKYDSATELADDMPLIGGEFDLDSLDILLVITSIEKDFGIRIRDDKMDRKAFTSIRTLADFVDSLGPAQ